ncbi:L-glutamate gamma-semialdehyde dehydrogenase [Gordonia sp. HNM0687]|uniref:L-glutamate gamma-semialdehyde dehydrogenase n=1 Tax=Gordonia mangrovi TaxID=2665643 RepID=A0A6L7GK31_9ACTN|nr:L-glutamate gamma-semialdehyde dehydrogenase [Gordonia mangrovi]MXP19797.1 L-glutamate gamma-semialdehyde dehydrogenase [Gordonia mangrovi]UVF79576.1 L-glutamate gamma-semialdehyde dehydrogenase [Gordonia mangrovi]
MTIANARIAGNPRVPEPVNEQARDYAPGSPEARNVLAEIDAVTAADVRDLPNVINGVRRPIGESAPVVAPHEHGLELGRIPVATAEDVNAAIDAALAARHDWSRMDWLDRVAIFLRAAELVNGKYRDELMATTMLGQSKTFHQAEIDVNELVDFFRYNVKLAEQIYTAQPFSVTGVQNVMDHRPLEGFVLALTPFNFTAIAGNLPSTPALMGNVVVWKPSEKSALSSDVVMRIFVEAGVPAGVINLVHGDGKLVTEVAQASEHLAGISFTGSTAVFRSIWRGIANNLETFRSYPRLVGETGGKNAVIAHPSADPQALLVALIRGAFEYQGQKCSAASRAYLPRSLWQDLREQLIETTAGLVVGDVTRHETFVGAVIDLAAADRLAAVFDHVKQSGDHEILVGGSVSTEKGWFVEPTIVETTDPRSFVMSEEFFGPLLSVYVYEDDDWEHTLGLLDSTSQYALTCSIFGSDRIAINTALDVLRDNAGMIYVNDKPTGATMGQQSFGGGRGSGTNDKTGSVLALQRWVSGRFIKENMTPDLDWTYPYMG